MIFVVSAMKKVVVQRRSAKKIFLKALKNICARVSSYVSLQTNAWIFIKKREYDTDVFPVNFVKFLRKSFSQNTSGECFCHEVSQIAMIKRRNLCKIGECFGHYLTIVIIWCYIYASIRSSRPEVFLGKGVLKICSKFTGEHLHLQISKFTGKPSVV